MDAFLWEILEGLTHMEGLSGDQLGVNFSQEASSLRGWTPGGVDWLLKVL